MFCEAAGGWGRCRQVEISMGGAVPSRAMSDVQKQTPCKDEARRRTTAKGKPTLDATIAATCGTSMAAPVMSSREGRTQVIGQSLPPLWEIKSAGQAALPSSRVEGIDSQSASRAQHSNIAHTASQNQIQYQLVGSGSCTWINNSGSMTACWAHSNVKMLRPLLVYSMPLCPMQCVP